MLSVSEKAEGILAVLIFLGYGDQMHKHLMSLPAWAIIAIFFAWVWVMP